MPLPRPTTEARSGSHEPGRPRRARSSNMPHPAGRPHTPPADRMYATDVRQTDVRQHHRLMPPGRGIIKIEAPEEIFWFWQQSLSAPGSVFIICSSTLLYVCVVNTLLHGRLKGIVIWLRSGLFGGHKSTE